MPPAQRLKIENKFPAAKEAAHETVQIAREEWLRTAKQTGESKANEQAASRGYLLQVAIDPERIGFQSARVSAVTHSEKWGDDPWFLRFFEYGTVNIAPMPFMRPAARKANKRFLEVMGDQLEGKIRRKPMKRRTVSR